MMNVFQNMVDDLQALAPTAQPKERVTLYRENCNRCNGTGIWNVNSFYSAFSGRRCFGCKGRGFVEFKTPADVRKKHRDAAARKREEVKNAAIAQANQWREEFKAEAAWLADASKRGFEFAVSLSEALEKYGHLTEKQLAAVRKCVVSTDERNARLQQEAKARQESAPEITVAAIEQAFGNALGTGIKHPRLRLDTFVFTPAKPEGKNPGAIYVKEDGQYLGKVMGGKFLRVRECSTEQEERVVAAAADPKNAAIAYGKKFGKCSVCARELSDEASIERGIGPVCAENYGW